MDILEAIKLLKHHQKWRMGADIPMIAPHLISQAIECLIMEFELKTINLN